MGARYKEGAMDVEDERGMWGSVARGNLVRVNRQQPVI